MFTSIEKTPVVASYNLLDASDTAYDTPDDALNPKSESSSPPTDPLYDPVSMEEHILKSDNGPKSPVEEYDKLVHSPTPQGRVHHLYTVKHLSYPDPTYLDFQLTELQKCLLY